MLGAHVDGGGGVRDGIITPNISMEYIDGYTDALDLVWMQIQTLRFESNHSAFSWRLILIFIVCVDL